MAYEVIIVQLLRILFATKYILEVKMYENMIALSLNLIFSPRHNRLATSTELL
jgi:hypothetical protein